MENVIPKYTWNENETHVCYKEENAGSFCRLRENRQGMVLPLVQEITWSRELRAALYLIGLLYRY